MAVSDEKKLRTWYNMYYGGMGYGEKAVKDVSSEELREAESLYQSEFIGPLTKMMPGGKFDSSLMNEALTVLVRCKVPDWMFLLSQWAERPEFYTFKDNVRDSLRACIDFTIMNTEQFVATVGKDTRDIIVRQYKGGILTKMPVKFFAYPNQNAVHVNGRYLSDSLRKSWFDLSDSDKSMLKSCIDMGIIKVEDTYHYTTYLAGNDQPVKVYFNTPNLPPRSYLEMFRTAPDISKEFMQSWVEYVISTGDDEAKSYIKSFQLPESVDGVYDPASQGLKVNPIADYVSVNPDYLDKTVEALLETDLRTTTLDDLILQYCNENNVSTECTIAQLVEFIGYDITIEPKVPDLKELLQAAVIRKELSEDTTVREYLTGVKPVVVPPKEAFEKAVEAKEEWAITLLDKHSKVAQVTANDVQTFIKSGISSGEIDPKVTVSQFAFGISPTPADTLASFEKLVESGDSSAKEFLDEYVRVHAPQGDVKSTDNDDSDLIGYKYYRAALHALRSRMRAARDLPGGQQLAYNFLLRLFQKLFSNTDDTDTEGYVKELIDSMPEQFEKEAVNYKIAPGYDVNVSKQLLNEIKEILELS